MYTFIPSEWNKIAKIVREFTVIERLDTQLFAFRHVKNQCSNNE